MKTHPQSHRRHSISYQFCAVAACFLVCAGFSRGQQPRREILQSFVTERGPHHRVWNTVTEELRPDGLGLKTNSYVELSSGMHHFADGQWKETRARFSPIAGGAAALEGPHKVIVDANVAADTAVSITAPDGSQFSMRIFGLAYYDSQSGNSVLIAEPKQRIGTIVGDDTILYADAFTDFRADVQYVYSAAGFESDVILHEKPPSPAEFNLNPDTTRLQMWTEFTTSRQPQKRRTLLRGESDPIVRQNMADPDFTDELLNFGSMQMGPGRAFTARDPENTAAETIPVGKTWATGIEGRTFLIESVEYPAFLPLIADLQAAAVAPDKLRKPVSSHADLLATATVRPRPEAESAETLMAVLSRRPPEEHGVTLDYVLLNTATNFSFRGDTTYFVSGTYTLSGTTTIEGGTVVKFTNAYLGRVIVTGPVIARTGPFSPAVFTVQDAAKKLTPAGVRRSVQESIQDAAPFTRTVDYAYDSLNHLTQENIQFTAISGTITYDDAPGYADPPGIGYDRVGNRRSRTISGTALMDAGVYSQSGNTFDPNDRVQPVANFDENGNTLWGEVTPANPQTAPDEYDFENRLIGRHTTNNDHPATVRMVYDGDGNRVRKTLTESLPDGSQLIRTTVYLVDDRNPTRYAQVIEELSSVNSAPLTLNRVYTYGLDLISQSIPGLQPTSFWYGHDGNGSVRLLTDVNGQVTASHAYDAFGMLLRPSSYPEDNSYLYAGEQYDRDLALYYLRARYYHPDTGRFWTMDAFDGNPLDPASLHKYLYVANNPANRLDPSGEFSFSEILVTGALLATLNVIFAPYTANAPRHGDVTYPPLTKDEILFSVGSGFVLGAGGNAVGQTLGVAGRFVANRVPRPFQNLFAGHRPRQGFSGVFDEASSRVNMKPSPNERGAPVPEGWVDRGGGHATLSLELGGDMASHYGFAVILLEDGTLEVTWVSRTLNPAPRFVVPRELRPQIVKAIEEATGRTVSKPNLE